MRSGHGQFPGRRQAPGGFGLVEILVALAIGALALLGAAAVAAHSLQAGGAALRAAVATNLAADMAGRMGVNRRALASYAGGGPAPTAGCTGGGVTCNPAERAATDWFEWLAAITAQLPRGVTAAIEPAAGAAVACPCTIEVRWPEPGEAEPARVRLVLP